MHRCYLILITLTITLLASISKSNAQADASLPSPIIPVRELKDVEPGDWAFSALQQLQQRYQCLQGYPDETFRGRQAINRYEFAAFLNRCLTQLETSIRSEEQATIQRLQTEFAQELAILRGKVDAVTARVRELEVTQFSPTTKLHGVVNFVATNSAQAGEDSGVALQARSRLNFNTSFTGRDLLLTRFTVGNSITPDLADGSSEFSQTHQWRGNTNNEVTLSKLSYRFPIGENAIAILTPQGGYHGDYNTPAVNPFFEDANAGTTTLSTFAQRNPILSLGGGSGLAMSYKLNEDLMLGAGYYAPEASNTDSGLFNGSYSTGLRVKWDAADDLSLGVNYLHSYFQQGEFGFNDGLPDDSTVVGTATVNNTLAQFPTVTNAYGIEMLWQANPKLAFGGRFGYTDVKALGLGNGEIWNYSFSVILPKLGQGNDLAGMIIGAQPYLGILEGNPQLNNEIPWHLEGFYRWQVSDQVSITPGIIWHPNPNQDPKEADVVTSTVRMTVTF